MRVIWEDVEWEWSSVVEHARIKDTKAMRDAIVKHDGVRIDDGPFWKSPIRYVRPDGTCIDRIAKELPLFSIDGVRGETVIHERGFDGTTLCGKLRVNDQRRLSSRDRRVSCKHCIAEAKLTHRQRSAKREAARLADFRR
jgi:hypothetical protein